MDESIARLDDMRLVAELVTARSFTDVARALGIPKQTVSRRVAALEASLGVRLVERTTRTFRTTALGRAYAERCGDIVRSANEVNREMRGEATAISGTLRITADPLFGERFLPPLITAFARTHPAVRVDVTLTSRYVDIVDEGFDVAFRVGTPGDASLVATRIADASLVFVASSAYAKRRKLPRDPDELAAHDCIALAPEGSAPRWAFRDGKNGAVRWVAIAPRIRVNHLGLAREAALAGLGIANVPWFSVSTDVARGSLRLVLDDVVAPFGGIFVVHASRRAVTARVRAFRDLAVTRLRAIDWIAHR